MAASATPPTKQIWSRDSTGLVKVGTPYRALVLNFANIGLVYIMFTYWLHPAFFPASNLLLSIVIAELVILPFMYLYALFATAMPRTGSEYIYISRTLHPAIGFACSFAAALSQSFWTGVGGYWISTYVLSPMLSSFGQATGNSALISLGASFNNSNIALIVASVFLWLMVWLNITGLRTYFRFQEINWWAGIATLLVTLGVLLFSSKDVFIANFNHYAQSVANLSDAYNTIIKDAHANGMPAAGAITLKDTLGIFPIIWLVAWASTYIGGEVQTPRKSQLWGTVGGSLLYTISVLLIAALIGKTVGFEFNSAASYLSYQSAGWWDRFSDWPTFVLWTALLIRNPIVLLLVGLGMVLWSYFWIPSAMIIATRAIFAWSFDRLVPEKLSEVHPKYHSPYIAVICVGAIGQIFVILFAKGIFNLLLPNVAYMIVFLVVSICGIIFPYLEKTKSLFDQPGVNGRIAGIPVMTLCGIAGLIYFGTAFYYMLTVDGLTTAVFGVDLRAGALVLALQFIIPLVLFFGLRWWRSRNGISVDTAFQTLPPD
jgi:APA family basic amino acid/polyamine antiporter